MRRKLIQWLGLTGVAALLSYAAAVIFAPLAYPGYDRLAQAVSDLSAETAPSRQLWNQLAAPYNVCGVVCATCAALFVTQQRVGPRLFRAGICLFTVMNWVSSVGYGMFPLADSGKEIASFREIMHMAVTVLVVLLSIASLVCLIIAGCRDKTVRGTGLWAASALAMMMIGSVGTGIVPAQYFGVAERFSVFAAVGFNAVLGMYLFNGFSRGSRPAEGETEMPEIKTNVLTAGIFLELYTSVGWEPPCEAQVRAALQNSLATFTAFDGGKPVGMARLIGDGGMSFYIKDFAVLPSHHGKGIGTGLIRALEGHIRDTVGPGWAVSLELISTKEAVPFYRRMGFEERPCEWDGPGMMKMLR